MPVSYDPPKYMMVRDSIVESIMTEQLPVNIRLAPIAKMSVHFGVSPSVIQKALTQLVDDGFVECRGSRGYYVCKSVNIPEKEETPRTEEIKKNEISPVPFVCGHHSDLVWRRTYEEADAVRREQTRRLIEIAEKNPEFCFYFEQTETPVRLPEFRKRLRALARNGQVDFTGAMCIPDLNMISGETFLRALLYGKKDCREVFRFEPEVICLSDAFGMPYQLPQMLAVCGYKYLLPGRTPNAPEGLNDLKPFLWNGPNGTSILVSPIGAIVKETCYRCNVPFTRDPKSQILLDLEQAISDANCEYLFFYKEEGLIPENICSYVEQTNRKPGRGIRFCLPRDYFHQAESREFPCFIGEFNPIFTGCYTTRIANKQRMRKAEIMLRRAEMLAAAAGKELNSEESERELLRLAFHDSLCGCSTDRAQEGIDQKFEQLLANLETMVPVKKDPKKFFIANTSSVKGDQLVRSSMPPKGIPSDKIGDFYCFHADLPQIGGKSFQAGEYKELRKPVKSKVIKTDSFTVDFNGKYPQILSQYDVFGKEFAAIRFRSDFGSMWTERFYDELSPEQYSSEGEFTVTEGNVFYRAESEGEVVLPEMSYGPEIPQMYGHTGMPWNGFESLRWKKEFYFPKCGDYFFLKLKVDFKGRGTKVLLEIPYQMSPQEMSRTDSVPFGSIVRKPYFEIDQKYEAMAKPLNPKAYSLAHGDWPVLDWNDFSDLDSALAIANSGTPGCSVNEKSIFYSLLRSGTALEDGSLFPDPGSFDNGTHEYWFAFRAHKPFALGEARELGDILNRMPTESNPLPEGEWLAWDKGNIAISSAEQKDGSLILRFYEYAGKQTEVSFSGSWLKGKKLSEITPTGEPIRENIKMPAVFAPFEIKTFAVK